MLGDIGASGADRRDVRCAAALLGGHVQFENAFARHMTGHFIFKFGQEPVNQAAHFSAVEESSGNNLRPRFSAPRVSSRYSAMTEAPATRAVPSQAAPAMFPPD